MTFLFKFASIFVLLRQCGPSTIQWSIISIVVFSIQCQFRLWSRTHIGKKISEIFPASAHFNPSASPIFPFIVVWICATLNHASPYLIFMCLLSSIGIAMLEIQISVMTAATSCCVTSIFSGKIIPKNYFLFSAIAQTKPSRPSVSNSGGSTQNKKSIKSHSSFIDQCGRHCCSIPLPALRRVV